VFVTRTKHVLVARAQEVPSPNLIVPTMKFEAYYRYGPGSDKQNIKAVFVARDRVRASPGGTFTF
jgi:hypothetical protein